MFKVLSSEDICFGDVIKYWLFCKRFCGSKGSREIFRYSLGSRLVDRVLDSSGFRGGNDCLLRGIDEGFCLRFC